MKANKWARTMERTKVYAWAQLTATNLGRPRALAYGSARLWERVRAAAWGCRELSSARLWAHLMDELW